MGDIYGAFDDETVIVTGGSAGIGRAVARGFGEAGATVVVADVREAPKVEEETTPTHEVIREAGGEAEYVETDVSDPDQIRSVVKAARAFGGVDVMVNNAGVHVNEPFREVTLEQFERVNAVNTRGVFFGTQAAANDMIERDEPGAIVNTASTTSRKPEWGHSHYAATKGAIRMITRSAAFELAQYGVRVNAVAPGPIATEITEGWSERAEQSVGGGDADDERVGPPTRAGRPEDLAGAYLYLASDQADYVTGTNLWVDGGSQLS
ncbi:SDR family NAD(P)-dependent oxidoreductase [Halomarina oriensis]|uniref:Glucose 1-dehydrogenase n=1 Tax=Halomarina oriensis TaxID=671145 RepID=A0A6B0GK91_9EURY|nr:SDR family oxidoreductase [Halomarina oriensis]MWG35346.1 glucose 1-dehydrogenase [Halomarina oriensis]